jgi:hypothetical protein
MYKNENNHLISKLKITMESNVSCMKCYKLFDSSIKAMACVEKIVLCEECLVKQEICQMIERREREMNKQNFFVSC